jgi:hypothetical protein
MAGITLSPAERDLFRIVMAVRQLTEGRSNATGTLTLRNGFTSTTVTAPNCGAGSAVFLSAATADAAAALVTTYVARDHVTAGQFTVTHVDPAGLDRTFYYVCLG